MPTTFASMIEADYPAFSLDDAAADAAKLLAEAGISAAPVLDGKRYVGMATLPGLLAGRKAFPARQTTLRSVTLDPVPGFSGDAVIIESLEAVSTVDAEVIAVLDEEREYAGAVTKRAIFMMMASLLHAESEASTIEMEVPPPGVRLSEIIAAIEKNDAFVLHCSSKPYGTMGEGQLLTFRVVSHDFFRLVRNLEKYGYLITYNTEYPDSGYDDMREKALEFIRYMDM
ncbi:MAG: CBS domain-containing protein [Chlorobiaceae bacterium]|nr:CBS domain-containing protein [Chlorobiaceae bacterium]